MPLIPLVLVLCILHLAETVQAARKSPNLIITLADDVSANEFPWLNKGVRGVNGAITPRLKKMAMAGVAFRTGWSMPICGPTRGSLVTGLYAQWTGWYDNPGKPKGEENSLGTKFGTFAQLAKAEGYKILIAGKWQMIGSVTPYGYDEACLWRESDDPDIPRSSLFKQWEGPVDPEGIQSRYWYPLIISNGSIIPTDENDFGPNIIFDCIENFIQRQKDADQKFMVYMPLLLPHRGFDFDRNETTWVPVPIVDSNGKIIGKEEGPGTFKRNLEYQDYLMGTLLDFLKKLRLARDTITFFIGDNGTHDNGKGSIKSETGTRVPFIVHGPSRVKRRFLSNELVSTNDIYNTVRGLLGTEKQGQDRPHSVDFSPYLLGAVNQIERAWLYAYRGTARLIRNKDYILDGDNILYRCPMRDERSCVKRPSAERTAKETDLVAKFRQILCKLELREVVDQNTLNQTGKQCAAKKVLNPLSRTK